MIQFFRTQSKSVIAVHSQNPLSHEVVEKLNWLFSESEFIPAKITGRLVCWATKRDADSVEYKCR